MNCPKCGTQMKFSPSDMAYCPNCFYCTEANSPLPTVTTKPPKHVIEASRIDQRGRTRPKANDQEGT